MLFWSQSKSSLSWGNWFSSCALGLLFLWQMTAGRCHTLLSPVTEESGEEGTNSEISSPPACRSPSPVANTDASVNQVPLSWHSFSFYLRHTWFHSTGGLFNPLKQCLAIAPRNWGLTSYQTELSSSGSKWILVLRLYKAIEIVTAIHYF